MNLMIEFCEGNLELHSQSLREKLEAENDEIEIMEYGCLGNCGECFVRPFAYVNGKRVAADKGEELYQEIKNCIKKMKEDEEAWENLGL